MIKSYRDLEVWQKAMDYETGIRGQESGVRDQGAGIGESQSLISDPWPLTPVNGYVDEKQVDKILDKTSEVGRMLNGLRRSIEKKTSP